MAAVDYFLKLTGIEGESNDQTHKGEIDILSFSWSETNPVTIGSAGGGAGAGKVSFQDLHLTKHIDKSSPNLMLACAIGRHFADATITCRKAGGSGLEFLKLTLGEVFVSSYSPATNVTDTGASQLPTDDFTFDSFSLAFAKIDMLYTAQSGEQVETTFDRTTNT
jgi:type VI secretion system secreted protein Hcp